MVMSTDVRELLREGMKRFTGDMRVPAGLARTVVRRHRRRRIAVVAVVAGGMAAVTVAGFAVTRLGTGRPSAGNPSGTHATSKAHTVAYVLRRAATVAGRQRRLIEYARSVELGAAGKPVHGYEVSWTYGIKYSGTGSYRREDISGGKVQAQYGTTWGDGRLTFTAVNYAARTWYRRSQPWDTSSRPLAARGCRSWRVSLSDYRAFLHWGLRCLHFRTAGRVEVDGVTTIKIVNVTRKAEPRFTLYFSVNPKTYLPVRTLFDNQRTFPAVDRVHEQTDYMWLGPTRANLANLTVRIPAGFKRTASPTLIGACGFAPCN
jgi:hypothetical protein